MPSDSSGPGNFPRLQRTKPAAHAVPGGHGRYSRSAARGAHSFPQESLAQGITRTLGVALPHRLVESQSRSVGISAPVHRTIRCRNFFFAIVCPPVAHPAVSVLPLHRPALAEEQTSRPNLSAKRIP